LDYLGELEKRMMELNYEKWSGNYKPLASSSLLIQENRVTRDEL